jgi:hypothetical protein
LSAQQGNWSDEVDDDDEGGGRDSSVLRDLRKANSAKEKRIKELEESLSQIQKTNRETSIKTLLESRELNPKIAALIPESVEPTEEAVSGWLSDYGDVFGVTAAEPEATPPSVAAMRQMDDLSQQTVPVVGAADIRSAIANAQTPEELTKVLRGEVRG